MKPTLSISASGFGTSSPGHFIWLARTALSCAFLFAASCVPTPDLRLNQALGKLPQTPEYAQPLAAYSVDQVVTTAKKFYPQVERTSNQIFVFDGDRTGEPMTYTVTRDGRDTTARSRYSSIISLDHDGTRLTGGCSSLETSSNASGQRTTH